MRITKPKLKLDGKRYSTRVYAGDQQSMRLAFRNDKTTNHQDAYWWQLIKDGVLYWWTTRCEQ